VSDFQASQGCCRAARNICRGPEKAHSPMARPPRWNAGAADVTFARRQTLQRAPGEPKSFVSVQGRLISHSRSLANARRTIPLASHRRPRHPFSSFDCLSQQPCLVYQPPRERCCYTSRGTSSPVCSRKASGKQLTWKGASVPNMSCHIKGLWRSQQSLPEVSWFSISVQESHLFSRGSSYRSSITCSSPIFSISLSCLSSTT